MLPGTVLPPSSTSRRLFRGWLCGPVRRVFPGRRRFLHPQFSPFRPEAPESTERSEVAGPIHQRGRTFRRHAAPPELPSFPGRRCAPPRGPDQACDGKAAFRRPVIARVSLAGTRFGFFPAPRFRRHHVDAVVADGVLRACRIAVDVGLADTQLEVPRAAAPRRSPCGICGRPARPPSAGFPSDPPAPPRCRRVLYFRIPQSSTQGRASRCRRVLPSARFRDGECPVRCARPPTCSAAPTFLSSWIRIASNGSASRSGAASMPLPGLPPTQSTISGKRERQNDGRRKNDEGIHKVLRVSIDNEIRERTTLYYYFPSSIIQI